MRAESLRIYTLQLDDDGEIIGEVTDQKTQQEAGQSLLDLTQEYRHQHPSLTFSEALHAVMDRNPELMHTYSQQTKTVPRGLNPAAYASDRALELVENGECKNFSEAAARVLREDPELGAAYHQQALGRVSP